MNTKDPQIVKLRESVHAAQEEFDMAVMFHETWKPTAYDENLHQRMGMSYATHTFNVIRVAVRREMVLALMRLWDTSKDALGLPKIANALRKPNVIEVLAEHRAPFPEAKDQMRQDLSARAAEAIAMIDKYSRGGVDYPIYEKMRKIRNERLAHRAMSATAASGPSLTDQEIEAFYGDNSTIIRLLLSTVNAVAYDPNEAGEVFRQYSTKFWASARCERTEGTL